MFFGGAKDDEKVVFEGEKLSEDSQGGQMRNGTWNGTFFKLRLGPVN